jgi:hypothetical protein
MEGPFAGVLWGRSPSVASSGAVQMQLAVFFGQLCLVRLGGAKQGILVTLGLSARSWWAIWDGYWEGEQSWGALLLELKRRGLTAPALADGGPMGRRLLEGP